MSTMPWLSSWMSEGSPKWSEANEVYINLEHFISGFMAILRKRFPGPHFQLRSRGDGALLVQRLPGVRPHRGAQRQSGTRLGLGPRQRVPASHNHSTVWWASEDDCDASQSQNSSGDLNQEAIQLLNEYRGCGRA